MRLEAYDKLGSPINRTVTRVVVFDDYDNPILIAIKYGSGLCHISKIGDEEFSTLLRMLGIDRTVVVDNIDVAELNNNPPKRVII